MSLAAAGAWAEIRVRDTGQGIEASLLPAMFEPFVQGEPTHSGGEGGLGLGLALVKGIAELHGGTVAVESAGKGRGAEFTVRLPLVPAPAAAAAAPVPSRAPARLSLLIVDDNPDAAESLAEVVQLLGHSAEVAYDGASAVAQARARWPDAVLCDLGLPGMSGYDVARALRAEAPAGRPLRLIAVSGYTRPEDVRRALEAGFDAHLAKPCDAEAIERMLA
jgi:CheY-like chemotaxis protein